MEDFTPDFTPFLTLWLPDPDMSESDLQQAFDAYKFRQQAIMGLFDGSVSPSLVLDILDEQAIDVADYVEEVAQSVGILSHA